MTNTTLLEWLHAPTGGTHPSFALEGLLADVAETLTEIAGRLDELDDTVEELRDAVVALQNGKPLEGLTFKVVKNEGEWS